MTLTEHIFPITLAYVTVSAFVTQSLLTLVFHELGHILAALALGMRVNKVGIAWRGAYVEISGGSAMANMLVSAAGPLVNAVLFLVAAFTGHGLFAALNLVFGAFQLIPVFGMDGDNVLKFLREGLAIPANEEA